MNHPLIQKTLEEFDEKYGNPAVLDTAGEYSDPGFGPRQIKTLLTTALQEALIAGLEMAEDAVPGKRNAGEDMYESGFEVCRTETLSSLASLKKEVMEGRK